MSLLPVIIILLPLMSMASAFEPLTVYPAFHLDKLFKNCESSSARRFCMGGKDGNISFAGGQGCLKDKNCEFLIQASRHTVPDNNGHDIEWFFCNPASKGSAKLTTFSIRDGENSRQPMFLLMNAGKAAMVIVQDGEIKIFGDELDSYATISEMFEIESEPMMSCVRFTSPSVMKFSNGVEFDLINDEVMLSVTSLEKERISGLHPREPIKLFKEIKFSSLKPFQSSSSFRKVMAELRERYKDCDCKMSAFELTKLLLALGQFPIALVTIANYHIGTMISV